MAHATQQHDNKLPYVEWQGFRNCLSVLRGHHSWSEISQLFNKQDSPGWAEKADQYRSLVTEDDVRAARKLVQQLSTTKPSPAPKKKRMTNTRGQLSELEQAEVRKRLNAFFERFGSWTAVSAAMGRNPQSGPHYKRVAEGISNGSKELLNVLKKIETEGPLPLQNGMPGRSRRTYERGDSLDTAGYLEVQQRLQRLYKKHKSWRAVSEMVGSGNAKSYYTKLAKHGGGGSKTLLNRLRALDGEGAVPTPATKVEALQKAYDTVPATPQVLPAPAAVDLSKPAAPEEPWPAQAQGYLRTALGIVEEGVRTLPKALQAAAGDLTSQIKLAIEELDSGNDDDDRS